MRLSNIKKRLVSSVVGILFASVIFYFVDSLFFNFVVSIISAIAAFEITRVMLGNLISLMLINSLFPILFPFVNMLERKWFLIGFVITLMLFLMLLFNRKKVAITKGIAAFSFSFLCAISFSSLIFIRDVLPEGARAVYLILVCVCAWSADTFAYLIGCAIGKHKLIEDVSPKKTWEGLLGGIFCSVGLATIICVVFKRADEFQRVGLLWLVLIFIVAAILAVLGDLVASLIKRQHNVKDFGNIMPGHGGVLDRLDSLLFVVPYFYFVVSVMN
ncbi:MAG: phosphatidate cytidylyltransferase [Oscillospiraceae bacterium]|jgi:phosphatidate cytidylyltransferase|nr:phosphatidate cytidylyltransferase [Oscillospiraceae bacterium]